MRNFSTELNEVDSLLVGISYIHMPLKKGAKDIHKNNPTDM
jgi:hypothetical protein